MSFSAIGSTTLFERAAHADAKADAQSFLDKGNGEVMHGDYLHALEDFQEAYAAFPSPKILLNIGTTLRQLGRNAEALDAYDRYLAATDVDEERKPEVREIEATLASKVGMLHVEIVDKRPPGAPPVTGIDVDAKPFGVSAFVFGRRVDVGPHSVIVTVGQAGRANTLAKDATVEGGKTATVHFDLVPDPVVMVPKGDDGAHEREEADRRRARATRRIAGIVSISAGVVGAVVASVTGGLILHDRSLVKNDCPDSLKGNCKTQAGLDAARNGRALMPANVVGWAVGIVGVGVGIPLVVSGMEPSARSQSAATLVIGPGAIGMEGQF